VLFEKHFLVHSPGDFPKWLPLEQVWVLEEYAQLWLVTRNESTGEIEFIDPELKPSRIYVQAWRNYLSLHRCLTSEPMRNLWSDMGVLVEPENPIKGQVWLTAAVLDSFIHPRSRLLTKVSAAKWKKRVIGKLDSLMEDLREVPSNYDHWFKVFLDSALPKLSSLDPEEEINKEEHSYQHLAYSGVLHPYFFLEIIAETLQPVEYDQSLSGSHVVGKNARRKYFCRYLTALLVAKTGKKMRKKVAQIASEAFDCDLGVRELIRLTEGIPESLNGSTLERHAGEHRIKSYLEGAKEAIEGGSN
jgi:hypothetical protein